MALLIGGLILFIGIHVLPTFAGLRGVLIAGLGEKGYKILFSVVSVAGLILTGAGYGQAPQQQIFEPSQTGRIFLPAAMAVAFVLVAVANIPGRIRRVVRHPMLAGILIWAVFHLLANGDLASNILFGSFALWAVFAILSAEYRGKRLGSGQGSLKLDLVGAVVGLLVYAVVFYFHADLFGVSPV
ncbi:NnrU family protein [Dongia deserti]|uniref:NnrU family protein n=1 Tax=Dongia deserti TaxID=2268030 RepID=UPI0013C4AAC6|nr:NnrU family protein [Dongia deserti]